MKLRFIHTCVLLLLCAASAQAQDNTAVFGRKFYSTKSASIAVVPFTPRMLISDIHRDMCVQNEMDSKAVQAALAEGFCHAMRVSKPQLAESMVYGWEDEWPEALNDFYGGLGYQQKNAVTQEVGQTGAYIGEGELRIKRDTVSRYMAAIVDTTVVSSLATETQTNFILVVTELDIVNLGDPIRVNPEGAELFVRLHYSLFDPSGVEVKGGLVKSPLRSDTYNPTKFAREEFIAAAEKLYAQIATILLPEPQTDEE